MILLDGPALLAWLQGEGGTPATVRQARVTAWDWAQVLDALRAAGRDVAEMAELLRHAGVRVVTVRPDDAIRAAELADGPLTDRLNAAVAERLGARLMRQEDLW